MSVVWENGKFISKPPWPSEDSHSFITPVVAEGEDSKSHLGLRSNGVRCACLLSHTGSKTVLITVCLDRNQMGCTSSNQVLENIKKILGLNQLNWVLAFYFNLES